MEQTFLIIFTKHLYSVSPMYLLCTRLYDVKCHHQWVFSNELL